ncbi:Predicted O-methyltransferase [Kluyvera cryocrescens]|uniref:Predicted O-methyltransferase n=1 Tax=Kluyvera cryocrescens TaxID=580 RepID=A0A485CQ63_KLUCR|nr:Predicted O-methyltransferase [Kluyvera cryocrescens]
MPISLTIPITSSGAEIRPPRHVDYRDNVVRDGEVTNPHSTDERVQGVRRFIEMMRNDPRLTVTALQTVGIKGWDGFTLAWVNG